MNEPASPRPDEVTPSPVTVPVIEEDVLISREQVNTGAVRVRVDSTEEVRPVQLEQFTEDVLVERVPVDREVDAPLPPWREGDVLVVPVYEEKVVLQRRIVLKEEIRLRTRRERRAWDQEVVLRRDKACIERRQADGTWVAVDETCSPESSPTADSMAGQPAEPSDRKQ